MRGLLGLLWPDKEPTPLLVYRPFGVMRNRGCSRVVRALRNVSLTYELLLIPAAGGGGGGGLRGRI